MHILFREWRHERYAWGIQEGGAGGDFGVIRRVLQVVIEEVSQQFVLVEGGKIWSKTRGVQEGDFTHGCGRGGGGGVVEWYNATAAQHATAVTKDRSIRITLGPY